MHNWHMFFIYKGEPRTLFAKGRFCRHTTNNDIPTLLQVENLFTFSLLLGSKKKSAIAIQVCT